MLGYLLLFSYLLLFPGFLLPQFYEQQNVPVYVNDFLSLLLLVRNTQGALLTLAILPKAALHPSEESEEAAAAANTFL